jgi:DNA-binding MarR family transcriptional regulator
LNAARRQAGEADRELAETAERLHKAAIRLLRSLRKQDEASGLSAPRLSALSVLVFTGPRTMGELAEAEQVRPPTMTRLVDGLVEDGLARRTPDPADRRVVRIAATVKGRRLLEAARARRVEALTLQLEALAPRDRRALARGVELFEQVLGQP